MLHDSEIARRENGRVVIRPGGLRVRWELPDLTSADGHAVKGVFTCTVRPLDDPTERKMLEEVFLGRSPAVTTADVAAHFAPVLEAAARKEAGSLTAEALLSDAGTSAVVGKIADAGKAVAFGCGVELLPPFEAGLDSPTLRRKQEEERQSAAQIERMGRASKLFKQFQEIRASAPELSAGQVLQRIGTADQGEMLRALLLASAGEGAAKTLWAVAGPYLVKVDWTAADPNAQAATHLIPLPPTLGPLRSVQSADVRGKRVLLVGARSGVLVVDPANPDDAAAYFDPQTTSSALGFNAAAVAGDRLWATHGEAGLVAWTLGEGAAPALAVRPDQSPVKPFSPRNLFALDEGRVLLSSGSSLLEAKGEGSIREVGAGPRADVVAVVAEDASVVVVHESGDLCRRDRRTLSAVCQTRRTGKVTAAGGLPWFGATRVLLATEEGPVYCVGLDDELVTQYASPHRGLRIAAAAADRVAAVSSDRQRLVLWPSWDGRKPAAEVHLAGSTKHRVADIDFG